MRAVAFRAAFLAAAAASAGAETTSDDTTTSTGAACAAQNILDACLSTTESYVSLCATTDYMCLCDKYIAIMTCFNNCPSDSREPTYQQQKDLYCMNASLYATTSGNRTISLSISSTSTSAVTTTTDAAIKSADVTAAASAPAETEPSQSGNAAPDGRRGARAGGMLAAVAGVVAALL